MKNIHAFDYDSKPTQPREGKPVKTLSDKEIRLIIMKSKSWPSDIGEQIRDKLENSHAERIAYYYYSGAIGALAEYVQKTFGAIIEEEMAYQIDRYRADNNINEDSEEGE